MRARVKPCEVEVQEWRPDKPHEAVRVLTAVELVRRRANSGGVCSLCSRPWEEHGYLEGQGELCPGDWLVKSPQDNLLSCTPAEFASIFELVD